MVAILSIILTVRSKTHALVGDEVTSLEFPQILKGKSETPYVVSYFF